ncbi:MAG TPA: ATP-dependent acyl-CoA ligase, partial [Burkholderiaceae bacterium]|nr:ATP-dependent acyl-CoA ligase [Burkholderiaceae bacterium]
SFLAERMAHFMVPRYLRTVSELPKTPTQKVQKHLMRSEGITADTFDRVRAGMVLRRQRI